MYRFVLRPRWLAFHLLVATLVVVMVNLGVWQMQRFQDRREFNDQVRARSAIPVAEFDEVVTDRVVTLDDAELVEWRSVQLVGVYVAAEQVTIINRSQGGMVGQNVVTPLETVNSELVLVNRGFIVDSYPVPPPPSGTVTITGRVRATQERRFGGLTDPAEEELTEFQRLDIARLSRQLPAPVAPVYLDLLTSDPSSATDPIPLPEPELEQGPHLSYMMQWFIFSVCAIVGWVLAIIRSARRQKIATTAPMAVNATTDGEYERASALR